MLTVVDASTFLDEIRRSDELAERGIGLSDEDDRSISELLVDQVEFANIILLNKSDLVTPQQLGETERVIRTLNREARVIRTTKCVVPLELVFNTRLYDVEKAEAMPGWARELAGAHIPETLEYGISSFVYRARRPFHPERLAAAIENEFPGVLRAKGFFWLASRNDVAGEWALAGKSLQLNPSGYWLAATDEDERDEESMNASRDTWDAEYGDRRQELVFIGIGIEQAAIEATLNDALLNSTEMAGGPDAWRHFIDALPLWPAIEDSGEHAHLGSPIASPPATPSLLTAP